MAHQIDISTGTAAVFVTGQPAWHRLGKVIDTAATSAEAIGLAGLNWKVEKRPLSAQLADGSRVAIKGRSATVRTDTKAVLGVVGTSYTLFQNRDAFDFMDALVGDKLAMYETAGSLDGGKRVWMLASIPQEFRAGPDDLIKPYVLLTNSHDGSGAMRMIPTTVRVVCQNTLSLALRGAKHGEGISIWHLQQLERRVEEARKNLGIIAKRFEGFGDELEQLTSRELDEAAARGFFLSLLEKPATPSRIDADGLTEFDRLIGKTPEDAKREAKRDARIDKKNQELVEMFLTNWENERNNLRGISHTPWAAYNAVSEWVDHDRPAVGKTQADKDNSQLKSMWFGAGNDLKQQAYASALELARN